MKISKTAIAIGIALVAYIYSTTYTSELEPQRQIDPNLDNYKKTLRTTQDIYNLHGPHSTADSIYFERELLRLENLIRKSQR